MPVAEKIGRLGAAATSTLWRGIVGALLCYVTAGLIAWLAYFYFFYSIPEAWTWAWSRGIWHWFKEIAAGLVGGVAGGCAGIWVLERVLKRYPGRTIAWIYCGLWIFGALGLLARVAGYFFLPDIEWKDVTDPLEIHLVISSLGSCMVFYAGLIQPKQNLMLEHARLTR